MHEIKKELYWYLLITLPVSYGLALVLGQAGVIENQLSRISMYVPALVVILLYWLKFKKPVFRKNDLGFYFTGWKYWFIAPIVITSLCIFSYLISYLINPALFLSQHTIEDKLSQKGLLLGNVYLGITVVFLLNGILGSLLNIVMFLGEELGWRGFMVPRLLLLFKPATAFLFGGAIWAVWHLVLITKGLNYPGHTVTGTLMMIMMCIPLGVIIQYFYYCSKSIFVAALSHAALNKSAMSMSFVLNDSHYNTFLYGPTGVVGILLFWLVAIYLYRKVNWKLIRSVENQENELVEESI